MTQLTEAELQYQVLELCKWKGLLVYHTRDSRGSQPGFPDLVIAGPRGLLFRELKSARGQLQPMQRQWRWMLEQAGQDWAIWQPASLTGGRVNAELAEISGGPQR